MIASYALITRRAVIVLDPTLKLTEVDLGYRAFLVAYSGKIANRLMKKKGWTVTRALNYVKSKFLFDQEIYDTMQEIVHNEDVMIVLNRNPTITFGSIITMKIRNIKPDPDDYTLSIPSSILPGQSGSFLS